MSRAHRRNLKRGLKVGLASRVQRVRESRHGKPHTRAVVRVKKMVVSAGYPGATRSIKTDPATGELFIEYVADVKVTEQQPVTESFRQVVACEPTGTHGQKNVPENMAPRGKAGSKPPMRSGGK